MAVTRIPSHFRLAIAVLMLSPLLLPLAGCTVFAEQTPTLANTTSAEQTQRLFWQDVKEQKWQPIQGVLTANLTWRNGKELLTRDAVLPYLQQLHLKDFLLTNVIVKSNGSDMTVLYDIQWTTAASPEPVTLHAVAIWQQLPAPPDSASKQAKKQAAKMPTYALILEDLTPEVAHP